jgi:hypothetical protein
LAGLIPVTIGDKNMHRMIGARILGARRLHGLIGATIPRKKSVQRKVGGMMGVRILQKIEQKIMQKIPQ